MKTCILLVILYLYFVQCRDFYVGMFKRNDLLVAQDYVYKEKNSMRFAIAKYGRTFKCPITYFRVVDRLGQGRGPQVKIIRGGLQKKYVVLRLTSPYDRPISVNIYVGCANKIPTTRKTTEAVKTTIPDKNESKANETTLTTPVSEAGPNTKTTDEATSIITTIEDNASTTSENIITTTISDEAGGT